MRTYLRLLADRRFAALSVGQMVSLLGDVLFPLVVLFAALQRDASSTHVALLVGNVYAVRFAALGGVVLFSGGFVDRRNPVRAAAGADMLRVAAFLALLFWWDGELNALILAVAALVGASEAVSEPAILIIGPQVVERGGRRSNSEGADLAIGLLEALRNVMGVAGPPIAALLLDAFGYRVGLGVCVAVFAVSAAATLWAGVASRRSSHAIDAARASDRDPSTSVAESREAQSREPDAKQEALARGALTGLGVMWRHPWLRYVQMLAVAQVLFAVGPWMIALPVAITNTDAHGVRDYSLILSAFAAGAIVGALLGGNVKVAQPGLVALPCLAIFGMAALGTGLGADTIFQIVVYGLAGVGTQVFDVLKLRGIRQSIPENELGRAYSADFFFSFAALPIGQIIGAALLRFTSPKVVLTFGGIFVLVTGPIPLVSQAVRDFGSHDALSRSAPEDSSSYPIDRSEVPK